jgi:hypothetical protein
LPGNSSTGSAYTDANATLRSRKTAIVVLEPWREDAA